MLRLIISSILFVLPCVLIGQSVSATYTAGDIPTNYDVYDATCNGPVTTLTVTLPGSIGSYNVTGIDIQYEMTAQNNGWMSDQRSQIHCQNTGNTESMAYEGSGNSGGTFPYQRLNVDIANGVHSAGSDIIFEMQAWRTFGMAPVCGPQFNKVDNNTWTITVYYEPLCANGTFTFSTQSEIDDFVDTYGACDTIWGGMTIDGTNALNTSGFSFIKYISEHLFFENYSNTGTQNIIGFENLISVINLVITESESISDLSAFPNLTSVGLIQIVYNTGFTNLSGIPNVSTVAYLRLIGNPDILNLSGMENLTSISQLDLFDNASLSALDPIGSLDHLGVVKLINNPNLSSLLPFPNIEQLTTLNIEGNSSLSNPTGFINLKSIIGDFTVKNNDALVSFFELPSLELISGDLIITENSLLENINTMQNMKSVKMDITIGNNDVLNSIEFFNNLKAAFGTISLYNNDSLSVCCPLNNILLTNVSGYYIDDNAPGCNTFFEIDTTCLALDPDQDGILTADDNCPNLYNPNQEDADSDSVGNPCDNCPLIPNANQADSNNNFIGNACESPASEVNMEIESQEVFINNDQKGIIMTDPSGNCHRLYVDMEGNLKTVAISCP